MPKSSSTSPSKLQSFFVWLDKHLLLLLSGFLLAFIPLFPKIPFYSPIEQYIVRVRFEDLVIGITAAVWGVQLLRKKIHWRSPITWFILAYIVVSFLSVISAVFVIKTVPLQSLHVAKTALHFFRYIEYFLLFFIVFASIKTVKDAKILLSVMTITLVGVGIYGYGQKYHYWPVYSTMNREFSKGVRLYLTEHARVQSTFAGHYDLAAYLVIVLPFILAMAYKVKDVRLKIGLHLTHVIGIWLLIVGAARSSFAAYGVSLLLVILIFSLQQATIWKKIKWGTTQLAFNGIVVSLLMMLFGGDIYQRFVQVLESYPSLNTAYHQTNKKRKALAGAIASKLGLSNTQLSFNTPRSTPPPNGISTEDAEVLVASDQRPVPYKPADVFVDVPDTVKVATKSADGTTKVITVEKPRTWSDNSLRYGLSFAIRLDTLWPQAMQGFLREPLFGSGYATLNKQHVNEFTIAESTDNNLLRTLGETGLLGFMTFYGAVIAGVVVAFRQLKSKETLLQAVAAGYIAAAFGLLINAIYIDVFAASKVAFSFWAMTGLLLGYTVAARKAYAKKRPR